MKWVQFEVPGRRYAETGYYSDDMKKIRPFEEWMPGEIQLSHEWLDASELHIVPPVYPPKVICVGLNYRDHVEECGLKMPEAPVLFMKPATAVIGPGDYIRRPEMSKQVDYEGELAVVIGHRAKNISPEDVSHYILGYTCANDVTARDLQPSDGQWTLAKSFDTFLPLGPLIDTTLDPSELRIRTLLNGEVKQDTNTKYMIFKIPELISYISKVMTLESGDVILTGTSSGIGPMEPGDRVTVEIEGIGSLKNKVI